MLLTTPATPPIARLPKARGPFIGADYRTGPDSTVVVTIRAYAPILWNSTVSFPSNGGETVFVFAGTLADTSE